MVALPVTLIWSCCVPGVVPERSIPIELPAAMLSAPEMLSTPAAPEPPGRRMPLLLSVLAPPPRLMVPPPAPAPVAMTPPAALVNPPVFWKVAPEATLSVPAWVIAPC